MQTKPTGLVKALTPRRDDMPVLCTSLIVRGIGTSRVLASVAAAAGGLTVLLFGLLRGSWLEAMLARIAPPTDICRTLKSALLTCPRLPAVTGAREAIAELCGLSAKQMAIIHTDGDILARSGVRVIGRQYVLDGTDPGKPITRLGSRFIV